MALVLSRKPGQAITVSGPATIRLSLDSPRARLLVTAEPEVRILREELVAKSREVPDDPPQRPS